MKNRLSLAVVLAAVTVLPTAMPRDAAAQLPFSLRVSGLYGRQAATIAAQADGASIGETETGVNALGAEVRVGLPMVGFDVGAHYLRHFGDTDPEFDADISGLASLGLGANEFAFFAEKHFALLPLSPVKPYLGAGASYARIELSSSIDVTSGFTGSDDFESSANVFRLYAVGGLDLVGGLGLVARAGYAFSGSYDIEGASLDANIGGTDRSVTSTIDYDGLYLSVGVSLFGF